MNFLSKCIDKISQLNGHTANKEAGNIKKGVIAAVFSGIITGASSTQANVNHSIDSTKNQRNRPAETLIYRVKGRDTLGEIARNHGVKISDIVRYNPSLKGRESKIYMGEKFKIPTIQQEDTKHNNDKVVAEVPKLKKNKIEASESQDQYIVKYGDTLYEIAERYGLLQKEIVDLNPQIKNVNIIKVGDVIQVNKMQQLADNKPVLEENPMLTDVVDVENSKELEAQNDPVFDMEFSPQDQIHHLGSACDLLPNGNYKLKPGIDTLDINQIVPPEISVVGLISSGKTVFAYRNSYSEDFRVINEKLGGSLQFTSQVQMKFFNDQQLANREYLDEFEVARIETEPQQENPYAHFDFQSELISSLNNQPDMFTVITDYNRAYHPATYKQGNKRLMLERYLHDRKWYSKRSALKAIRSREIVDEPSVAQEVEKIFKKSGFEYLSADDLPTMVMKVESSGGRANVDINKAKKERNPIKRAQYITLAVDRLMGEGVAVGPYQISAEWIDTEKEFNPGLTGPIIEDQKTLRSRLSYVIDNAISRGYSISQINDLLGKIDMRFDIEKMAGVIMKSFVRIYGELDQMKNLSKKEKFEIGLMAYNRGEFYSKRVASKINNGENLRYQTRDLKKRLSHLKATNLERQVYAEYRTRTLASKNTLDLTQIKRTQKPNISPETKSKVVSLLKIKGVQGESSDEIIASITQKLGDTPEQMVIGLENNIKHQVQLLKQSKTRQDRTLCLNNISGLLDKSLNVLIGCISEERQKLIVADNDIGKASIRRKITEYNDKISKTKSRLSEINALISSTQIKAA